MNAVTTFDVLDAAEKIELLSSELYAALAVHFGADAEAAKLFTRLRDEEQQHAARVRMLAAQARRDARLLGKIPVDTRAFDDVLIDMTAMTANVRAGAWQADLARTKRLLVELEGRCERAHAQALAGANASLRGFFDQLAAQDKAHGQLLGA